MHPESVRSVSWVIVRRPFATRRSTSLLLWTMSPRQYRLPVWESSCSALRIAVTTPKQNPESESISMRGDSGIGYLSVFFKEPGGLGVGGEVVVIEDYGVGGLSQRAFGACAVYVVALADVLEHFFVGCVLAFGEEFGVAASCAFFGGCVYEYFHFGVGEYGCADVSSVHYDASAQAVSAHHFGEGMSHVGHCRYGAHVGAHGHGAYFVFYVCVVEVCV